MDTGALCRFLGPPCWLYNSLNTDKTPLTSRTNDLQRNRQSKHQAQITFCNCPNASRVDGIDRFDYFESSD